MVLGLVLTWGGQPCYPTFPSSTRVPSFHRDGKRLAALRGQYRRRKRGKGEPRMTSRAWLSNAAAAALLAAATITTGCGDNPKPKLPAPAPAPAPASAQAPTPTPPP